jgi:hypothetical protein
MHHHCIRSSEISIRLPSWQTILILSCHIFRGFPSRRFPVCFRAQILYAFHFWSILEHVQSILESYISLPLTMILTAAIAQSVYRWAKDWAIGYLQFDSRRGLGIFRFTTASRTALGFSQPPIQRVPGALFLGVKQPGRDADHSPPSSAGVKEWVELHLHSPTTPLWRDA